MFVKASSPLETLSDNTAFPKGLYTRHETTVLSQEEFEVSFLNPHLGYCTSYSVLPSQYSSRWNVKNSRSPTRKNVNTDPFLIDLVDTHSRYSAVNLEKTRVLVI